MEKSRRLIDILSTFGVGLGMLINIKTCAIQFYEEGKEIAPRVQEYIGSIGAGAIEYGFPALAALGTGVIGLLAVRATDQYLLNQRREEV